MSSFEQDPFRDIPELQRMTELEQRRAELVSRLEANEFAAPEIKNAYQAAVERVTQEQVELATNPEVQNQVAESGLAAAEALAQIEPLRGVLPDEEISVIEEPIKARIERITAYYTQYEAATEPAQRFMAMSAGAGNSAVGGATGTIETPPAPEASPAEPQAAPKPKSPRQPEVPAAEPAQPEAAPAQRKQVTITLGPESLTIGKDGRSVPYTDKWHSRYSDYSTEKKAALAFVVEHGDRSLRPIEIWKGIKGEDVPYDPRAMKSARVWFDKLTFRRQKIILFNGKRGAGALYELSPAFEINIVDETGQDSPATKVAASPDAGPSVKPQFPEVEEKMLGDLRLSSLFMVAHKLKTLNKVLEAYEKPIISEELLASLADYQPDLTSLQHDDTMLRAYRRDSYQEVQAIFEDDEKFVQLIDSLDQSGGVTEFVEYLADLLENPEDRKFVSRLISSRPMSATTYVIGRPDAIRHRIEDENGAIIWPIQGEGGVWLDSLKPKRGAKEAETHEADTDTAAEDLLALEGEQTPEELADDLAEQLVVPEAAEPSRPIEYGPASEGKVDRRNEHSANRKLIEDVKNEARQIADTFLDHLNPDKTYTRRRIQAVFNSFSTKTVREAKESRIGPRGRQPSFGLRDVVDILLYNNSGLQSIIRLKQNQKVIERIVDVALTDSLKAHGNGTSK